ncbi:MAG: transposase [Patescibacteria group bacterium]|nr:transposase [Patescibacteria group bacterium]
MPGREIPLVSNEIYHVFNRGTAGLPTFYNKRNYIRALETLFFYQSKKLPLKYSHFLKISNSQRELILQHISKEKDFLVEIISFCLMPNHFHLLLKQITDGGISKFMSNFSNSYTRYLNTSANRFGPLFQGKFKAVRIETDEQLIHVNRYLHINPYTSYVVKTREELENYPYSSLPEYLGKSRTNYCAKEIILDNFKSIDSYKEYIFDEIDYERELHNIKHLVLEEI